MLTTTGLCRNVAGVLTVAAALVAGSLVAEAACNLGCQEFRHHNWRSAFDVFSHTRWGQYTHANQYYTVSAASGVFTDYTLNDYWVRTNVTIVCSAQGQFGENNAATGTDSTGPLYDYVNIECVAG